MENLNQDGWDSGFDSAHPPDGPKSWYEYGFLDYICPQSRRGESHSPASYFEHIIGLHWRKFLYLLLIPHCQHEALKFELNLPQGDDRMLAIKNIDSFISKFRTPWGSIILAGMVR